MDLIGISTEIPMVLEIVEDRIEGPFSVLFDALRSKLNFSLISHGTIDFGELFSNKNGSGLFGSLIRNESHFSVVPMFVTEKGVSYLDYTTILCKEEWNIISGPPQIFFKDYFSSLRSFEISLWKMLGSVLFFYALYRTVITQFLKPKRNGWDFVKSFGNYLFSSMIVLANKYHYDKGNRTHERLSWISWTLPCMLLSLSFTGLLLAKLAKKDKPFRYETLEDILQDSNMKLLLTENTPTCEDIKTSNDPIKREIWNKVNREKTVLNWEDFNLAEAFEQTMEGRMAILTLTRVFFGGSVVVCGLINEINVSKKPYSESMFTLYMRRDLDQRIRNTIKYVARQIAETYILDIKLDFLTTMGKLCIVTKTPELSSLSLTSLYFILIIYIINIICGICCFVLEILVSQARKKRATCVNKTHT